MYVCIVKVDPHWPYLSADMVVPGRPIRSYARIWKRVRVECSQKPKPHQGTTLRSKGQALYCKVTRSDFVSCSPDDIYFI